ncbi:MAG: hypothetical protein QS99_C0002G0126 [archaeon GW2011_AR4]|nr:MAG: hypothetical protein QS99_C0002G0126 [archaeon GW2011_AR4]
MSAARSFMIQVIQMDKKAASLPLNVIIIAIIVIIVMVVILVMFGKSAGEFGATTQSCASLGNAKCVTHDPTDLDASQCQNGLSNDAGVQPFSIGGKQLGPGYLVTNAGQKNCEARNTCCKVIYAGAQ